jgi:competence protein ComEA helix-hairpin-helix repeat region
MKKTIIMSIILGLCLIFSTVSFLFLNPKAASAAEATTASKAEAIKLININTASAGELTNLKGIGEKTAQAIIEYREKNGVFKTIEDIKNVKGISDNKFEAIKGSICVK